MYLFYLVLRHRWITQMTDDVPVENKKVFVFIIQSFFFCLVAIQYLTCFNNILYPNIYTAHAKEMGSPSYSQPQWHKGNLLFIIIHAQ